jgi:undecaprenyl-diphosphatase
MEWWLAVLLGILQGVTEWLPISSSGHMAIFQFYQIVYHILKYLNIIKIKIYFTKAK